MGTKGLAAGIAWHDCVPQTSRRQERMDAAFATVPTPQAKETRAKAATAIAPRTTWTLFCFVSTHSVRPTVCEDDAFLVPKPVQKYGGWFILPSSRAPRAGFLCVMLVKDTMDLHAGTDRRPHRTYSAS